jgi:pilus assembly protein CpaE
MLSLRSSAALKPEGEGILAVMQEPSTIDRVQGVIRELQLDDELTVTDTLDAALRRIRSGAMPRVLLVDLSDSAAPIAEVSAARAVGGTELKLVVLGTINDVSLFRDLLSGRQRLPGQAVNPRSLGRRIGTNRRASGLDPRWARAGDRLYRQPRWSRRDDFRCFMRMADGD